MSGQIRKVLVIKLSALGDFVLALAAMRKIREAHRKAHITLLTTGGRKAFPAGSSCGGA
jgi:ADP-heptose:LPS heptosyltransferase